MRRGWKFRGSRNVLTAQDNGFYLARVSRAGIHFFQVFVDGTPGGRYIGLFPLPDFDDGIPLRVHVGLADPTAPFKLANFSEVVCGCAIDLKYMQSERKFPGFSKALLVVSLALGVGDRAVAQGPPEPPGPPPFAPRPQ